jgi:adenosylcobinamide-GDP ribazoletransferase
MRSFLSAVSFLTRLPVPQNVHHSSADLLHSARWFPLVGWLLGGIYFASGLLLRFYLPSSVIAVMLLLIEAWLTGALHLDGLADTADGFGGGRTREEVLRIMRDHSIGTYGTTALVLLSLLKATCLTDLLTSQKHPWVLLYAPILSRWSMLLLTQLAPYARNSDQAGTGEFSRNISRSDLAVGTLWCLPLPFLYISRTVVACWFTVVFAVLVIRQMSKVRIGGYTGDVLGATAAIAETLQLAVALIVSAKSQAT